MHLTLEQLATMANGVLSVGSDHQLLINNVVIDSRLASDNCLFVAIKGQTNDGHQFVNSFLNQSRSGALVDKKYFQSSTTKEIPNLIFVDDTIKALGMIAHEYRKTLSIPVVGITGSNGKTTVKEMLKSICESQFGVGHVLATDGNYNNHIGMPLTLLRVNKNHKVALLEMGMNHTGELTYLSNIANPNIATINNIMLAHVGHFHDLNDIAKAKGEIFSGLLDNGIACINQTSIYRDLWLKHPGKSIYFGEKGTICYIKKIEDGGKFSLDGVLGEIKCNLQVLGEHNKLNALTAAALAINLGCSAKSIQDGLNNYTGFKRRLERKEAFNGALLVDDTYNANLDSTKAAILAIKNLPKPHWFVFGDLKEQGKYASEVHLKVGEFAFENGIECLLTFGEDSKLANSVFKGAKMHFTEIQDIVEYCFKHLPKDATLLIKGSNSMNLNEFVSKIVK